MGKWVGGATAMCDAMREHMLLDEPVAKSYEDDAAALLLRVQYAFANPEESLARAPCSG